MMNRNSRGLTLTLAALLLVSIIACVFVGNAKGENYTEDYSVFSEVKNITTREALLNYCDDNNVEYTIKSGLFSMKKYDVKFSINKTECFIQPGSHCNWLELLDNHEYGFVTVKGHTNAEGEMVQTLSYRTLTHRYTLSEGGYRVITAWPGYVALLCALAFGILLIAYVKYCISQKREYLANHNPNMD